MSSTASPPAGVLVLGMHRSGTSVATEIVHLLGPLVCAESDRLNGNLWNRRGYWESVSLNAFNDELLAQMGSAWWRPPPAPGPQYDHAAAGASLQPADGLRQFLSVFPESGPWVWKDPRACVTLPFWRAAIGEHPAVAVVRDPVDVAHSLFLRNSLSHSTGLAIWTRYNQLWMHHAAGLPVLMTSYRDLLANPFTWSEQVREFLSDAGVPVARRSSRRRLRRVVQPSLQLTRKEPSPAIARPNSAVELTTAQVYQSMLDARGPHPNFVPPTLDSTEGSAAIQRELDTLAALERLPWNQGRSTRPQWQRTAHQWWQRLVQRN